MPKTLPWVDYEFADSLVIVLDTLIQAHFQDGKEGHEAMIGCVSYVLSAAIEAPEWAVAALQKLGVDEENRRLAAQWLTNNAPIGDVFDEERREMEAMYADE